MMESIKYIDKKPVHNWTSFYIGKFDYGFKWGICLFGWWVYHKDIK